MTSSHASTPAATEAIPRPRGVDNLRRVRQLFADPSTALDGLNDTYGRSANCGSGPTQRRRDASHDQHPQPLQDLGSGGGLDGLSASAVPRNAPGHWLATH